MFYFLGFDGLRRQLAANRAQFYRDLASGPFYGYNRPGAKVSPAVVENWWRQGMMGGAKAHHDGIRAFSETDFTEDLKIIDVPTPVMPATTTRSSRSPTQRCSPRSFRVVAAGSEQGDAK